MANFIMILHSERLRVLELLRQHTNGDTDEQLTIELSNPGTVKLTTESSATIEIYGTIYGECRRTLLDVTEVVAYLGTSACFQLRGYTFAVLHEHEGGDTDE